MSIPYEFLHVFPEMETTMVDGKRHYLTPSGKVYPSVTTVLSYADPEKDKILENWKNRVGEKEANRISGQARVRGHKIHLLLEKYLKGEPIHMKSEMPATVQSFNQMKRALDGNVNAWHGLEAPLYSDSLRIAGRTDMFATWKSKHAIVDFKTSLREKRKEWIGNYFTQAATYAYMIRDMTGIKVDTIVIVITCDDTPDAQVFEETSRNFRDDVERAILTYRQQMKSLDTGIQA